VKRIILFVLFLTFGLFGTGAMAAPTLINLGDFSSGDTQITFNSLMNEELVTTQYIGQGVTFSGSLYGLTNPPDLANFPLNGGGVIASNWIYRLDSNGGLSFTANFTTEITRVGFYLENSPEQTANVELFDGATSLGFLNYNTIGSTAQFLGIQETSGFNSIVFTNNFNNTANNGFFAIDDLYFGTGNIVATPEPASLLLLGFGLISLAGVRRFRQ
jgi:hypothetical protein